ncbi:DNA primase large subunit [Acidilobus saccharovorans 345-15]|uniref:DNA primase large subunit PriL n=1 Tax=Acidilobus saccharovorans (strain DSM 16705 / JCM 18335 / VKM B-2471 / 345-15) TaxID=666510 RepID=D9Q291_ACIS3|nr:DNA primase large subunit [Acidilobus saccharovorans]ADL19429.1 DNA primase large subunit [Acidilobus saccharovorans 345-15]
MLTYSKYPFIVDAKRYLSEAYGYQVSLKDLAEDQKVFELAKTRLLDAVREGKVRVFRGVNTEEEVASFYLAAAAAAAANSKRLEEMFSRSEARRAMEFLKGEDEETLLMLAKRLGVNVTLAHVKIPWSQLRNGKINYKLLRYAVPISDYLKIVVPVPHERWSLVNSMVKGGLVFIDEETLREFLSLASEKAIYKVIDAVRSEDYKPLLLTQEALIALNAKDSKVSVSQEGPNVEAFPPCMLKLKEKAETDEEIYAYISFLASLGVDYKTIGDELARLLKLSPGAGEALARSLIEAGLGSTYKTYSCKFMKSKGLCPTDCGASHPLLAYRRNLAKLKKPVPS